MGAREAEWEVWALGSGWVEPEGPGWPGARAAGGAGCWFPPPWRAVGPVVPLHFRAAGEGDGAASFSLFPPPSHLFRGRSRRARRRAREEAGDLRGSPAGEERRRRGPQVHPERESLRAPSSGSEGVCVTVGSRPV